MKTYRVEVVMTNIYHIEADDEAEARRIASENYFWGEDADIHMSVAEEDEE